MSSGGIIAVKIDREAKRKLEDICKAEGTTISELLRKIIGRFLKSNSIPPLTESKARRKQLELLKELTDVVKEINAAIKELTVKIDYLEKRVEVNSEYLTKLMGVLSDE